MESGHEARSDSGESTGAFCSLHHDFCYIEEAPSAFLVSRHAPTGAGAAIDSRASLRLDTPCEDWCGHPSLQAYHHLPLSDPLLAGAFHFRQPPA